MHFKRGQLVEFEKGPAMGTTAILLREIATTIHDYQGWHALVVHSTLNFWELGTRVSITSEYVKVISEV